MPTLRHPEHPWAASSFDSLLWSRKRHTYRNLEIKTAGPRQAHRFGESGTDQIPMSYLCQVHWQNFILAAHLGSDAMEASELYVLIAGQDDRLYRVQRDIEFETMLFETARDFRDRYVVPRIEPPVDFTATAKAFLEQRIVERPENEIVSTGELDKVAAEMISIRNAKRAMEQREDELKNVFLATLDSNSANTIRGEWGTFTSRLQPGGPVAFVKRPCVVSRFNPKRGI